MIVYLQMIETQEDKEKFEVIYSEYRGLMHHIAYDILHNEQDAEDAVHNAFVKIAENISKIGAPDCPKTKAFIVTVIETKSIDIYRRKQRHPVVPLNEVTVGIEVPYTDMSDLAKCIAKLPPRYRHMLALKYRHGYDNHEAARILDISLANAIKLDQRAKTRLRELCEKEGIL